MKKEQKGLNDEKKCEKKSENIINAYDAIGNSIGFSGRTVRNAFMRRPIPYRTARIIAEYVGVPIQCFRYTVDGRAWHPSQIAKLVRRKKQCLKKR